MQEEETSPVRETAPLFAPEDAPFLPRPPQLAQGLAVGALRDRGQVREINQDSIFALLTTLPRGSSDLTMGLFIVADGMGGHEDGEIASRLAIRTVAEYVFTHLVVPMLKDDMAEAIQSLMTSAVEKANTDIWQQAQQVGSDMGATCTAALLLGRTLYIAHVGDSRAYLLQDGQLRAITTDHSAVGRLIQLGQLDASVAREHPLRNQLYRSVGLDSEIEVDLIQESIEQSTHLLLCSDGLWDMVLEEAMAEALQQHACPQNACQHVITLANNAGGEDNISAIVVTLPIEEE